MGNVIEFKKNDEQITEVVEVATSQLTEHSKQAEYSPPMNKKKWAEFVANIKENGIRQPLTVTKGFRVIDGKHRLKAAKELGIESVRVIIEDIDENSIPSYITDTKLQRDDLKRGQKAAIVIRLFYEEERQKAREREARTQFGNTGYPNLDTPEETGATNEILAKKAGLGKSSMAYLLAVYRNRPDLFELVFDGTYTINKAYTQMKADEEPEQEEVEHPIEVEKKIIEQLKEKEAKLPQIDESQPTHSLNNRLIQMRKNLLLNAVEVIDEASKISEAPKEIKDSALTQIRTMAITCVIALGQNSESDKEKETWALIYELMKKLEEEN